MNNIVSETIIDVQNICKSYKQAEKKLLILDNVNAVIKKNTITIITGKSGSGKSTFLHLLGALDKPDTGKIFFNGQDLAGNNEQQLNKLRNKSIGFVFQFHHLLADFTAYENIIMPLTIYNNLTKETRCRADEIIKIIGLDHRKNHYPHQLSGGEQQRAAIGRSLVRNPELLLADEPTGNLDNETSADVMRLFWEVRNIYNTTVIIVTHDKSITTSADNHFEILNNCLHNKKL